MLQVHIHALRALVHVQLLHSYRSLHTLMQDTLCNMYADLYLYILCTQCVRAYTYYNDCVEDCRAYLSSPRRVMISACESLTVLPSRLMNGPVMQRFPAVNSTHDVINHWQVPNTGYHYMYVHMCTFIYVSALKVEHVSSASLHTSFRLIYKNGQTL